jgi:hypothetical protein
MAAPMMPGQLSAEAEDQRQGARLTMGPARVLTDLTLAEAIAGRGALAAVVGEVEAARMEWLTRLVLRCDGVWCLRVRSVLELDAKYRDQPWHPRSGEIQTRFHPIAEAVDLLRNQKVETEVDRRERLIAEKDAKLARLREEERRLAKEQAAENQRREQENTRDRKEYRAEQFEALSAPAQMLYVLAARVRVRDPELAADLRAVAAEVSKASRGATPNLGFPRDRWWEA